MGLMSKAFAASPYIEVLVRRIYWNSPKLIEIVSKRKVPQPSASLAGEHTFPNIIRFRRSVGIKEGDLIVVHSSAGALRPTGLKAQEIVDEMLNLIGNRGTIAMPAFPKYKDEPQGIARMRKDVAQLVFEYDIQRSIPWTGALPLKLMQRPGAVRSAHPLNTMVAYGPLARPMMENNLRGDKPLPCGPQSSWKFCADHGAKVVALGVDMAHSLTMIHVAEDSYEREWPVKGWYRDRKFFVVDGESRREVVVRERHPK